MIDENATPIVRDIFQWKIERQSAQDIADKLNTLGSPRRWNIKSSAAPTTPRYLARPRAPSGQRWR
ncbi:recombinase family protein [Oscillibacter sp. GMB15532]|uniref:recombinase family protein n=1 Tax=Oscillibacter sp. GMB15532 TaxID=3230022 RepID=UPI0034E03B0D